MACACWGCTPLLIRLQAVAVPALRSPGQQPLREAIARDAYAPQVVHQWSDPVLGRTVKCRMVWPGPNLLWATAWFRRA
eukprot:2281603-Amphidinium_carterae.3